MRRPIMLVGLSAATSDSDKWRDGVLMQGSQFSAHSQSASLFGNALQHARQLITARRVGYTLAGAFVLAGAAMVGNGGSADHNANESKAKGFTTQTSAGNPGSVTAPSRSTTSTFSSQSTNNGTTDMHLNVNGRNVSIPDNGSSQQTVTNSDGSQTTVDVSNSSTSQSSATNSSSSNFSLHVQSKSSSSKGGE